MVYETRIIAFIDILGFKNIIDDSLIGDITDDQKEIKRIYDTISLAREVLSMDDNKQNEIIESMRITHFSDSFIISFQFNEKSGVFFILLRLLWLSFTFAFNGFLCRGALTIGKIVHDEKVVFGLGLVSAYQLESKKAKYPRIILDKKIIAIGQRFHGEQHDSDFERKSIEEIVTKDKDNFYYIDYISKAKDEFDCPECDFQVYISNLKKITERGLKSDCKRIIKKYEWLKEKLNQIIKHYKSDFTIKQLEESGFDDLADFYRKLEIIE